jgi:hypothetical protein
MRTIKLGGVFVLLSLLYLLIWNLSLGLGTAIFPIDQPSLTTPAIAIILRMGLATALNTAVVMLAIAHSRWWGWRLVGVIALAIYAIQFFLAQIEAVWFNAALGLPLNLIYATSVAGLLVAGLVAWLAVWLMGRFKQPDEAPVRFEPLPIQDLLWRVALLAGLIYPALYFLAGHFIAWQFEPVRLFYSHSTELRSFGTMLAENLTNGLWLWQIARGLLWVGIGLPVLVMTRGGFPRSGVIVGLLFAVLMNAQLLLPNPYMPGIIPLAHALETASSNFVWGFVLAWLLTPRPASERDLSSHVIAGTT